ncbi:hypothetical protein KY309_00920 [Candidatus Woesearchaeota archaeon]|nr:hypothetical protein [Candidatus Woesearchaeota archaeon]MBW3016155.1 hypothetical protein [Candidatus Woesearchaeota archaeon]
MSKEVLEKKAGSHHYCGLRVRTFDYINSFEGDAWRQPGSGMSGPFRADLVDEFRLSLDELVNKCKAHYYEKGIEGRYELALFDPKSDRFVRFLDDKKIDGVCRDADDSAKVGLYLKIREKYQEDREAVVSNVFISLLAKKPRKFWKRVWDVGLHVGPAAALLLIGYYALTSTKDEFNSAMSDTKSEVRGYLEPKNIEYNVKSYLSTPEGQNTINEVKVELRNFIVNEGIIEDKAKDIYEKMIKPDIEQLNSPEKTEELARRIVLELFGFLDDEKIQKLVDILKIFQKK